MEKSTIPRYIIRPARQLRQRKPPQEDALWTFLRDRSLVGAKFRRQHPLGRYIVDFYCHEASLAVELEGSIHEQEGQREYDAVRREVIEQLGVRLVVIKNEGLTRNPEGVLSRLQEALNHPHPRPLSPKERGDWRFPTSVAYTYSRIAYASGCTPLKLPLPGERAGVRANRLEE